jgi:hypothetical protein
MGPEEAVYFGISSVFGISSLATSVTHKRSTKIDFGASAINACARAAWPSQRDAAAAAALNDNPLVPSHVTM